MSSASSSLTKAVLWGGATAILYGFLFHYSETFSYLAHTTQHACAVQEGVSTHYYSHATPEACAGNGGEFIPGRWWFVFAPIAMAFALSYTHGIFTGLFWDVVGLKARK